MRGSGAGASGLVAIGVAPPGGGGRVVLHRWDGASAISGPVADVPVDAPTWLRWSTQGDLLVVASEVVSTFDVAGDGLRLVGEVDVPAHPRQFTVAGGHLLVGGLHAGAVSVHPLAGDGLPGPGVATPVEAPACVAVRPRH